MCKYCGEGLRDMRREYKRLDTEHDTLGFSDAAYFKFCEMEELLRNRSIFKVSENGGEDGITYYFTDGTSLNPTCSEETSGEFEFSYCPMCGRKLTD